MRPRVLTLRLRLTLWLAFLLILVPTGASEDESDYDPCPDPLEPTVEKFCKGPADILPGPVCKLNIVGLGSGSKLSWYRQGRNRENENYSQKNILLTLLL